jgi:hypothetical protein
MDDVELEEGKEFEKRSSVSLHWRKGTRFGYSYISISTVLKEEWEMDRRENTDLCR